MRHRIAIGSGLCLVLLLVLLSVETDATRMASDAVHPDAGTAGEGPRRYAEPAKLPNETAWLQRTYPHFQSSPLAYQDALAEKRSLKAAGKSARTGTWQFAGPTNIGGRVTDLAIHPDRPQTLYAGAATGGVFRSDDLGNSWTAIFDEQPFLGVGDLAIAPSNPDVMYVGTGEANGGHNNYAGGGLFRSDDAGTNWEYRGLAETVSIGRVVVHPDNPDRLWVAAVGSYFAPNPERGVYASSDGGLSWERTLFVNDSTGVIDLVMRPDNPDVLFASTWQRVRRVTGSYLYGRASGIHRSVDGGQTWEELGADRGLPHPNDHLDQSGRARIGRIGLDISPSFPETIYAYYTDGSGFLGLFRSSDGGDSWENAHPTRSIINEGRFGFSWFFGQVRVDPVDPAKVWVLDTTIMSSDDGGVSFDGVNGTHVDHHALIFHPSNPNAVFEGNDGGVAVSINGGVSWERLAPLPITQFYEIAFDPVRPERLFGGTQDNGTVWTSTGALGDWKPAFGGDGFYVLPIPNDGTRMYAESQWGNLVRVDGLFGNPFPFPIAIGTGIPDLSVERRNFATPLAMDPFDPDILYYGTYRVWRTEDGVSTNWVPISEDLTRGTDVAKLGTITNISVHPLDSNVIWVGTDDGKVWVSQNYGASWTDTTAELPMRWVTRVYPAPDDVATAYVTFSGLKWRDPQPHVFRTRNLGATWEDITADLPDAPVNAIAVDPSHTDRIFVGTDIGMFASRDDGASWLALDGGMPAVTVADLKTDAFGRRLIAGTHGRGMYTYDLDQFDPEIVGSNPDPAVPAGLEIDAAFPNPFTSQTRVRVSGVVRGAVVYDVLGRIVAIPEVRPLSAAASLVEWDGTDRSGGAVSTGQYLIVISGPDGQRTVPVVKLD